jgi:ABC-type nitrate/sulfonate/bicarbonate transport system permease component
MTAAAGPRPRRRGSFRDQHAGWVRAGCYALSVLLALGFWQAVGNDFSVFFASFGDTLAELWRLTAHGPIPRALATSGGVFGAGLGISIVGGVAFGLALARSRWLAAAFEGYVYLLYSVPTIMLVPFIFTLMGFGFWPQVLIVVLIAMYPVFLGVLEGARSIPQELLDVAAIFGSTERQLWADVILPYVVPFAMTGVRQAVALALVGTLVAEFFLNATGVAAILLEGTTSVNAAEVLAVTLLVAIVAVLLVALGQLAERWLVRWK